ncbi:Protein of unknown function [Pyronema omphalodes CBS 100304]|uniref:Uncharacterized protein n=1 Tax=Pyronema omphalodes (strain CBS 100304) TaxID=1076935 RepID=U4LM45_PYROM|nr:Protein of unknown function [Pyronema omphalodes CBS 100304]
MTSKFGALIRSILLSVIQFSNNGYIPRKHMDMDMYLHIMSYPIQSKFQLVQQRGGARDTLCRADIASMRLKDTVSGFQKL